MDTVALLRPPGLVASPFFSHVAVVPPGATTVYVGGQNAVDADGRLVGGDDVAAQTTRAVANVQTALAAAGATLADVVSWSVLIVEGADLQAGAAAAGAALDPDRDPPLITVARVAGLAVPGALVEISVVAAVTS
ncbi:RidA family protein [Geodermatophilus sp. SYSU D00697]